MNDESESAGGPASGGRRRLKLAMALLFSLLSGAVLTVLVAWAIALQAEPRGSLTVQASWPAPAPADWPAKARSVHEYKAMWGPGGLRQWHAWGNHYGDFRGDFKMWVTEAGWPALAMRSTLRKDPYESAEVTPLGPPLGPFPAGEPSADSSPAEGEDVDREYDNDGLLEAGLIVGLHHSRPHDAGEVGWRSRRLPLEPAPLGFAASTLFWAAPLFGLLMLRRAGAPAPSRRNARRRWINRSALLLLGLGVNLAVAFGLWGYWQFGPDPLRLKMLWLRPGVSADFGAAGLEGRLARWPAPPPQDWPDRPIWIGWQGEAAGVQAYEFTSRGIPSAAAGWYHVSWGPTAFDDREKMHVVQIGWPLPCLQSEELIDIDRTAPSTPFIAFEESRSGPVLTLPGAPVPAARSQPAPPVPVRPLPLGMVLNTLLFMAAISLLISAPRAVRALTRTRAGCCVSCGYDVRGLTRCPECGERLGPGEIPCGAHSTA